MLDSSNRFRRETLGNGVEVIGEGLPGSPIAAINLRVCIGARDDPPDRLGLSHVVQETLLKGAAGMDARQLLDAFDLYGVTRGTRADLETIDLRCGCLPRHVDKAVELMAKVIQEPALASDQIEVSKRLSLEELKSLEDEPQDKVGQLLWQHYLGEPLGRQTLGTAATVDAIEQEDAERYWRGGFEPRSIQIAMSGGVEWEDFREAVVGAFGDWRADESPSRPPIPEIASTPVHHENHDSEQTHITLAFPSVAREDDDFYAAQLAIAVLSGGASSRLFTEVREKRGLVYSVRASWSALKNQGHISLYAGTTVERADETLEVCLHELRKLRDTITQEELDRARKMLRGQLQTTAELSGARVRSIAGEFYLTGRTTPIGEVISRLETTPLESIRSYLDAYPMTPTTIVSLGPKPLTLPNN